MNAPPNLQAASTPDSDRRPLDRWLAAVLDARVARPADGRTMAAIALVAVATDVAVRSGVSGLAGALLVVLVGVGVVATDRVPNPQAKGLLLAAPLFGVWLAVRASPWLLALDVLAAGGLLVLGSWLARGGSVLHLSLPHLVGRGAWFLVHGVTAPAFAVAPLRRSSGSGEGDNVLPAVLRGLALAAPVLALLGFLLASADAVFASFFPSWDVAQIIAHVVLWGVGGCGMAALLRAASADPPEPPAVFRSPLGGVEAVVLLGGMVALFAAFAVAQLVAVSNGGRHVLATAGLTYAAYARSGFFQLLAVAAITLVVLCGLPALTDMASRAVRRWFVVLAEAAVALTLVVVVVALRRLDLYEDAFGLTMLRLLSQVFAVWLGAVFVLLGCSLAGVACRRGWFPATAVGAGLLALLALNLANPEAVVVRTNLAHARHHRLDPGYLAELSADAVPALVAGLPGLAPGDRQAVLARVCRPPPSTFRGPWAANAARWEAARARARACSSLRR